jgi:hypothetical protein
MRPGFQLSCFLTNATGVLVDGFTYRAHLLILERSADF